jgi:hypothetical protein
MVALGMVYIIKYGSILKYPREVLSRCVWAAELLKCSLCLGFWVGVLLIPFACCSLRTTLAMLFPFASAAWCWSIDALHDAVVCSCNRNYSERVEDIID